MKKCILVAASPDSKYSGNPGGQQTASKALVDSLNHLGFDVEVIDTLQSSFPVPGFFSRLRKGIRRLFRCLYLMRPFQGTLRPSVILLFASSGGSLLERLGVSVLARILNVPSILFLRSGHTQNAIDRASKYQKNMYMLAFSLPNCLVVQGSAWRVSLNEIGVSNSSLEILPNWSSLSVEERIQKGPIKIRSREPGIVRFVYCGWLVPKKGIYEIVGAIKVLCEEGKTFEFLIIGGGDLDEFVRLELEAEISIGIVIMTGWVERSDIDTYFTNSSVLVLPSYAEGFPNVIVEALAARLPVIASDVGGIGDSIIDGFNGAIIDIGSVESLADRMRDFVDGDVSYSEYSENAWKTYLDRHSYASGTKSISRIIDSVALK